MITNILLAAILVALGIANNKLERIKMNGEELADALEAINTRLQKAMTEIIAAIQAGGTTTPRVDAAIVALQAAAQALDELNPDAP